MTEPFSTIGGFVVIEVGCLECGVPTVYKGYFSTYELAHAYLQARPKHGSDIAYYIFDLTKPEKNDE